MPEKTTESLEKELAELKQEFEDFAYIVSHDLSGPLRHASGFAEMVLSNKESRLDDKSKRHLSYIIESAERGRQALELLRDYSRLNTRDYPLLDAVDLNDIIQDVLDANQEKIEISKAVITLSNFPKIKCTPDLMQQAFTSLLDNALVYHLEHEAPIIHIGFKESASHFIFTIKDIGIGIAENRKDDIFKIFKRAVGESDYPGDGMGLTLAKKIAQKHGGDITVQTKEGEGSIFSFSISKHL